MTVINLKKRMRLEYLEKVKGLLNLMNCDGSVDCKWKSIKDSIYNAANTVIGEVKKKWAKDCFDGDCAVANDKKNAAYSCISGMLHKWNKMIHISTLFPILE